MTDEVFEFLETPNLATDNLLAPQGGVLRCLIKLSIMAAAMISLDGFGEVSAQENAGMAVLSIPAPDQPVVCSMGAQGARIADSRIRLVLEVGEKKEFVGRLVPGRILEAQFDSAGHLWHLSDTYHNNFIENVTLSIDNPGGSATGLYWRMTGEQYSEARTKLLRGEIRSFDADRNSISRDVVDADRVKAEALGKWLWERRCLPSR